MTYGPRRGRISRASRASRLSGASRIPRRSRRARILLCSLLGVLLLAGGGAAAYTWHRLNRNISSVELGSLLTPAASATSDLNILVVGSDSRAGKNASRAGGGDDTGRSDTTLLLHVYGGRKKAAVVSIPRDTMVNRPACTTASGQKVTAREGVMFNSVYETGGARCTVAAVEALSGGLRVNHYVEVGFDGFAELMDAVGGTDVTLVKPIDDKQSGIHLAAGKHHLNGQQALDLVRTRHGVGNGSDLGRIQLQHQFLTALIGKVSGQNVLTDPARLFTAADAATKSLTTDSSLARVDSLASLAYSMKGIGAASVQMVTLPAQLEQGDEDRLVPDAAKGAKLWAALKADKPVPDDALTGTASGPNGIGQIVQPG
ncbi:transcriptional regulator [Streptomyces xanthochromogenes]|uniref:LCP family protein n=1 Tax=Streptomyces xanthochromogenes TaxID=67384 RepID=UPI00167880D7|nr:LCP family protein [Streptomyces xanthochromogenes]GHB41927.1 transcriptional regulator [Streptomyces xanthochromogenes]